KFSSCGDPGTWERLAPAPGTPGQEPRDGPSGRGVEEIRERGRGTRRQRYGWVGRKTEMVWDLAQDIGCFNRGDDGHAAAAAGARQNVQVENPPHQVS